MTERRLGLMEVFSPISVSHARTVRVSRAPADTRQAGFTRPRGSTPRPDVESKGTTKRPCLPEMSSWRLILAHAIGQFFTSRPFDRRKAETGRSCHSLQYSTMLPSVTFQVDGP